MKRILPHPARTTSPDGYCRMRGAWPRPRRAIGQPSHRSPSMRGRTTTWAACCTCRASSKRRSQPTAGRSTSIRTCRRRTRTSPRSCAMAAPWSARPLATAGSTQQPAWRRAWRSTTSAIPCASSGATTRRWWPTSARWRSSPGLAQAHFSRAFVLLLLGDYAAGWKEYEWRWRIPAFNAPARRFAQPIWDGATSPAARFCCMRSKVSGDTLQFVRYAPLVAQRCAEVVAGMPAGTAGR